MFNQLGPSYFLHPLYVRHRLSYNLIVPTRYMFVSTGISSHLNQLSSSPSRVSSCFANDSAWPTSCRSPLMFRLISRGRSPSSKHFFTACRATSAYDSFQSSMNAQPRRRHHEYKIASIHLLHRPYHNVFNIYLGSSPNSFDD
jgi:hypothetical protein